MNKSQLASAAANTEGDGDRDRDNGGDEDPSGRKLPARKRTKTGCLSMYRLAFPFLFPLIRLLVPSRVSSPTARLTRLSTLKLVASVGSSATKVVLFATTAPNPRGTARVTTNELSSRTQSVLITEARLGPSSTHPSLLNTRFTHQVRSSRRPHRRSPLSPR